MDGRTDAAQSTAPWGWDRPGRAALIGLAATAGAALFAADPEPMPPPGPAPALRVDPNRAPAVVLGTLPGIGPALSAGIVAGRDAGPYDSAGDLDRRVKGIGPAKARALAPFLRFDADPAPPTPR